MKSSLPRTALPTGLVLVSAVLAGCQSLSLPKVTSIMPAPVASLFGVDKSVQWADKDNPVARCICLWQPADGTWEGRPSRGFGGQVFFLDRKKARPVAVTGDIRIHVFDDFGPRDEHGKAVHTFDFTKGAWNAFLVKTQFGPAYNVFIPYTRAGHHKTECALRVRLVEKDIPTIFSDMSYVKLEGSSVKKDDSTDNLAAADSQRRSKETTAVEAIGQISRKDGVRRASVNKIPAKPQLTEKRSPGALPPQLEARLAALQQRKPVMLYDKSQTTAESASGASSPDIESAPSQPLETDSPRRLVAPVSVSPILPGKQARPRSETPHVLESSTEIRKRHSLAPVHPLDEPSASREPIDPLHTDTDPRQVPSSPYDRMIREAEVAAAGHNWSHAIRLASRVDRAVRSEHFSWPLNLPTPSALVAGWEIQRIDMAADGDAAERTARVDSRVDDYLKASRGQLDKNQPSEARRLATVAHLISRAASESVDVGETAPGRQGGVISTSETENRVGASPQRVSLSGWAKTMEPEQSTRPAHPLEAIGANQ